MTIDERLEHFQLEVRQEFKRIDGRFVQVDAKIDALDARVGKLEEKVDALDAKIDGVETSLRMLIEHQSSRTDEGFAAMNRRFDDLESRHNAQHAELRDFFYNIGSNHEVRINRLEKHTGLT